MGEPGETAEGSIGPNVDRPQGVDPAAQTQFGAANKAAAPLAMPSPSVNFNGLGNIDGVYPPDTNGEVGPNHYVQWVNSHFQIFNKSGVIGLRPGSRECDLVRVWRTLPDTQ